VIAAIPAGDMDGVATAVGKKQRELQKVMKRSTK